jgi:glycosyltransferase involved in cell wall biosynthesis
MAMDREVDVVILTKDSEAVLSECLRSVYDDLSVKSLIVVDGFSKDDTLKILDRYNRRCGNIRVVSEHGSRGKARQRGLQEVSTEWFMFVDSDVILCDDWFEKAGRYVGKDVGAI